MKPIGNSRDEHFVFHWILVISVLACLVTILQILSQDLCQPQDCSNLSRDIKIIFLNIPRLGNNKKETASHEDEEAGGDLRFNVSPLTCSAATNIIRCHTSVSSDKRLTSLVSIQVKDTRELSNRNFSYKFWLFSVLIIPITPHSHSTLSFYCYCS